MRVVTLLPAATEIVAALGGAIGAPGGAHATSGPTLVGISHECDAFTEFGLVRARQEVAGLRDAEAVRLLSRGVEFLDGNAYTSRPGPRLVDAAERLAALIPG